MLVPLRTTRARYDHAWEAMVARDEKGYEVMIWTSENGVTVRDAGGKTICVMGAFSTAAETAIVVAAPQLLSALVALAQEESRDDDDPLLGRARVMAANAIAKAAGKNEG